MSALSDAGADGGGGRAAEVPPARRVVLGIGNILNRDEGVGVHALRALEEELAGEGHATAGLTAAAPSPHDGIELFDGGVLGLDLLPLVEECSHLLVLDAVDAGLAPGAVVELDGHDLKLFGDIKMSQHQVTFEEVLGLAALRDRLPEELRIIGVQPADLGIGVELSPDVAAALPEVVARARAVIAAWPSPGEATSKNTCERTART